MFLHSKYARGGRHELKVEKVRFEIQGPKWLDDSRQSQFQRTQRAPGNPNSWDEMELARRRYGLSSNGTYLGSVELVFKRWTGIMGIKYELLIIKKPRVQTFGRGGVTQ